MGKYIHYSWFSEKPLSKQAKKSLQTIATVAATPAKKIKRIINKKELINDEYLKKIDKTINDISNYKDSDYIVLCHDLCIGIIDVTKELFDNVINCQELYRKKDVEKVGRAILDNNIKQVIFSGFGIGNKDLAIYLKKNNKNIKIKVVWNGKQSQILSSYNWKRSTEVIKLLKKGIIDVFATNKKSLVDFYNNEGYKSCFISNIFSVDIKTEKKKKRKKEIRIGLYSTASDSWEENIYTQIAAASLIKDSVIDIVPLNEEIDKFAKTIGAKVVGSKEPLPTKDLLVRMSNNDINLHVTYSECSPIIPLESFEMHVPCILGNNNHYFDNSKLSDYIVVNNETNPIEIKEKIEKTLQNNDKVLKLYDNLKKQNTKEAKKLVEKLLKM